MNYITPPTVCECVLSVPLHGKMRFSCFIYSTDNLPIESNVNVSNAKFVCLFNSRRTKHKQIFTQKMNDTEKDYLLSANISCIMTLHFKDNFNTINLALI